MTFMPPFDLHAPFHVDYLRAMLAERNVRYSKNHPRDVTESHYINELVARAESTGAIASFYHFYKLCQTIKNSY